MNRKRLFFRIAAYAYVVYAGLYLAGSLAGAPEVADEPGKRLMEMLHSYHWNIAGLERTTLDLLNGQGFSAAAFAFFVGVLNLAVLRFSLGDRAFMQTTALLNMVLAAAQFIIAGLFLLYPAILCFGVALLGFVAAFLTPAEADAI